MNPKPKPAAFPQETPGSTQTTQQEAWSVPTIERRGSVADLVQIAKVSGHADTGNTKRNKH